ncbi:hypothetical protein [Paenibacillus polymyxa]|uniref:hypothetical protein n=1 Tax=Paenibacillus polymyxa TaxID=1406 RepID=UPI003216BAF7
MTIRPSASKAGHAVFEQGSFPPVRIQVPADLQYTPPQPESKERLVVKLEEARRRMHEIEASLQNIDPERLQRKATHPPVAFGAVNAVRMVHDGGDALPSSSSSKGAAGRFLTNCRVIRLTEHDS